jgi:hypothetical protein
MKHLKPVTVVPTVAQVSPTFEAKFEFKINLTDQAIDFTLTKTA